ncbi:type I polyketide synthase [Streptomyces sp. A1136]|uniref:type I polyketide synthase n=1 Tax=Streptomyces sp. A1136 TaxID=2563102 RepID=UPI00109EB917|nr:type I polyketide synthase [Streptomyces sp. A1136]THA54596.1 acyltransferase domain-containing protein [Streptomyces sp. A1136]
MSEAVAEHNDRTDGTYGMDGADDQERIAVVGLACRVPGADDPDGFWRNLVEGVESIERLEPPADAPEGYVPAVARIKGVEDFDAEFFGMTPREAALADPQQRLFLEQCWAALEDAGCDPERSRGRIGVWGGTSFNSYLVLNVLPGRSREGLLGEYPAALLHGNDKDYLTSRVAHRLGLTGPAVTVQTACSTSLVAVAEAARALLDYQCDMALAGGASVKLPQDWGYVYETGGIQSPDGYCRAFDADAAGTVFGSGAGVVALKRLSDALADGDRIHAVILGSAVNNDGSRKSGYTAPSTDGQADVLTDAYFAAGVSPASIGYVEAHGTGTAIGDPIELAALDEVFGADGAAPGAVAIGSVKTNIGHLNAASGVVGLIKAVLAVREGELPPSLHYRTRNPRTSEKSPFTVNDRRRAWPAGPGPRRAGVSSFGVGGTNAHVVLEQPPAAPARTTTAAAAPPRHQLITLSARTSDALAEAAGRLADVLGTAPAETLPDIAHTLARGRRRFPYRTAVAAAEPAAAAAALRRATGVRAAGDAPAVFLFPGQGTQYQGMTAGLLAEEPEFARHLAECAELFAPHTGTDLLALLSSPAPAGADDALTSTRFAQPALFAVEYALARWWTARGVRPAALLGHSLGEWTAAAVAGVMGLEDAVRLVAARGRLMEECPRGVMLAVELTEAEARTLEGPGLTIAALNAPARCVLSGTEAAVAAAEAELAARGVAAKRLVTSHAFHSPLLDPMVEPFADLVAGVRLNPPRIPFASNVTGTWITDAEATDPRYWAGQARAAVRFADGVGALLEVQPDPVLLELGPGRALGRFAAWTGGPALRTVGTVRGARQAGSDRQVLLQAVGDAWAHGVDLELPSAGDGPDRPRITALPGHPMDRRRHWIDAPAAAGATAAAAPALSALPAPPAADVAAAGGPDPADVEVGGPVRLADGPQEQVAALWRELLGIERIRPDDDLFMLGGDSLNASQLISRANRLFRADLPLEDFLDEPTVRRMAELAVRAQTHNPAEAVEQ